MGRAVAAVGGLHGAAGAAVDEDGLDGALHAVAAREGAGTFRALAFRQLVAAGRAQKVPIGALEGNRNTRCRGNIRIYLKNSKAIVSSSTTTDQANASFFHCQMNLNLYTRIAI